MVATIKLKFRSRRNAFDSTRHVDCVECHLLVPNFQIRCRSCVKQKKIDYTKVHQSSGCASYVPDSKDDGLCRAADHGHLSQVFFVIARGILEYVQSGSIDFENRTTSALDCDERGGAAR